MHSWTGWKIGRDLAGDYLAKAFGDRQKEGREAAQARRAEADRLRAVGRAERAAMLDEIEWKKSWAFARHLRRREEEDAKRYGYKLGAALRKNERLQLKATCTARLYRHFEYGPDGLGTAKGSGSTRDLFFEYIPRGFSSGKDRNFKREKKRSNARTARWKSGEFGRKVRYIEREDALEEVEGNILSSMGDDIAERVACSRQIEQLESVDRDNAGVYRHLIIALPHELSPQGRARLLAELVQPLRDVSLPFDAALHKPDRDGDQRNFHVHILVSLRPMQRVGDHEWTFAAFKRRSFETPAGLGLQRRFVARAFNRALAQENIATRWTHLSRRDRGLASPGNTKKFESEVRLSRKQAAADRQVDAAKRHQDAVGTAGTELDALHSQSSRLDRVEDRFDLLLDGMHAELSTERTETRSSLERLDEIDAALDQIAGAVPAFAPERAAGADIAAEADESEEALPASEKPSVMNASMLEAERMRELQADKQAEDRRKRDAVTPEHFGDWFDPALPNGLGERRQASHDAGLELELDEHGAVLQKPDFKAVQEAFTSAEPQFFVGTQPDGEQLLYARDVDLLASFARLTQDRASWPYLDAIIEVSPEPPADRLGELSSLIVRVAEPAKLDTPVQSAAQPQTELDEDGFSVVEQHIALKGIKPGQVR